MGIVESLDKAIMLYEIANNPGLQAGYCVKGEKTYGNYLSVRSWLVFMAIMRRDYPNAFSQFSAGGGKEIVERKIGKYTYPPKMASFASSSRMIFNIMKSEPDFIYEKQLPTTVGGKAYLDGFIQTQEKFVFVEAKCHEPYSSKSNDISVKYKLLYEFLSKSENGFSCDISPLSKDKIRVIFKAGDTEIKHFDIKQMICHLLGIATAYLTGKYDKKIDFVYLLYNPTQLTIENESHRKEILKIYDAERAECEAIPFDKLFSDILRFLVQKYKGFGTENDIDRVSKLFSFRMCDQYNMKI